MKDIVIIGAGGMGRETAWLIEEINKKKNEWNLLGFLDEREELIGKVVDGYKVLGKLNFLESLSKEVYIIVAIGNGVIRKKIVKKVGTRKYPVLIHPNANISNRSLIEEGTIICSGAVISIDTKIGKHNIINFNSIIAHDSKLSDFVTIHVNVNISGNVEIGKLTTIGSGSSIYQGKKIGECCMVGLGSSVLKRIKDNKTALGVPAEIY